MIITSVIAKGLAIVDALLSYFATSVPLTTTNICGTVWVTYNAELTACGTSFVADLVALITGLTRLAPSLLEGLLAV
jgi:hypothetical protein